METKIQKNNRIKKELIKIEKNMHDMYIHKFICKCTETKLCKEFLSCFSKYEMDNYMNLTHLTMEQKNWILESFIEDKNKDY